MLWYKSLREIRMVTLTGASAMAATCALFVLNQQAIRSHAHGSMPYLAYIWKVVYDGSCQDIFIALCIILGSGGLLQEKAHGTAGFTLAFPGSRRRIVFTPALVGYFGIVAIASVPVLVVPIASRQVGEPYPVEQCLGFFILWTSCGAVFYGLTFFSRIGSKAITSPFCSPCPHLSSMTPSWIYHGYRSFECSISSTFLTAKRCPSWMTLGTWWQTIFLGPRLP